MREDEANCCVCEAWFPPEEGCACLRCPDDWLCSAGCLARHRATAPHRENQRAWLRHLGNGGEGESGSTLWRATVEVNRGLRRRLVEAEAALHVARAEVYALRRAVGERRAE